MKIRGAACAAVVGLHVAAATASACDICGCYTPSLAASSLQPGPFDQLEAGLSGSPGSRYYAAVSEQFTHFGTLQFEGEEVANRTGQFLDSSITQMVGGYRFGSRFALQLNLPLIYRSFERPEGFEMDRGTESGLGDISLLGRFLAFYYEHGGSASLKFDDPKNPHFEKHEPEFTAAALLMAGVKFPTGDTSRLKESTTPRCRSSPIIGSAPASPFAFERLSENSRRFDDGLGVVDVSPVANARLGLR